MCNFPLIGPVQQYQVYLKCIISSFEVLKKKKEKKKCNLPSIHWGRTMQMYTEDEILDLSRLSGI